MFVRGDIMRSFRTFLLALLPILALTAETAPAGSDAAGAGSGTCGVQAVDPGLRAAFARFDRGQSAAAAKICAFYLNSR
jgi:hypothetical protein